ncbi:hypothetical protein [Pseudomonas sp. TWR1-1-4]|uniref:hypothetical protein n=1 Tax=Pseudomonas sp. TWR1-1-4 TaxID=2804604 RepID=UPI003CEA534C
MSDSESALSDIECLHRISLDLIGEQDLKALSGKIVDAALSIPARRSAPCSCCAPKGARPVV